MKKFLASVAVVLACSTMAFADATYDVKGKMFSMDLADLLIVITT